jgi:hypothetical protein
MAQSAELSMTWVPLSRTPQRLLLVSFAVLAVVTALWRTAVPADERGADEPDRVGSGLGLPTVYGPADQDGDRDGISDSVEDALAERFAPVVYHGEGEVALPVNVDWWLQRTSLSSYENSGTTRSSLLVPAGLAQEVLLALPRGGPFDTPEGVESRSRMKRRTLFLGDVAEEFRRGSNDPGLWTTYVHSYLNTRGGITLQYWRAYTWNQARVLKADFSHGGDWEAVTVHLDPAQRPFAVAFLQHAGIAYYRQSVAWEGSHPLVYSEEGGHASSPSRDGVRSPRTIRQETWTGGHTTWPDGVRRASAGLLNVGEKSAPRNRQVFVQYSGLWGAVGRLFITSGYWGPAFNETSARCDDGTAAYRLRFLGYRASRQSCGRIYLTAWCDEMAAGPLDLTRECYARRETQ